ncbi:general secretion pathway protein B [Acidovorax sp. 100]|uniref:general secretion pathway protein GspB n=1 Tax=Acidovorax sp. 100 TaxID=2135635 RepID=UPI000EF9E140|nr:general secretion pathway protein GspB [Acidovorax sp. 100]RMA60338.1 general secretion pathway protein B [Acidovorax sp. 100]
MSYILDALRRAEAERGRGAVPGIHTPAVPVPGAVPVAGRSAISPVLVAVAVVVVAAVAAGGTWWFLQRPVPAGAVVVAAAPATSAAVAPPMPAVASTAPPAAPAALPSAPEAAPAAVTPPPAAAPRAAAPQRERPAPVSSSSVAPRSPATDSERSRPAEPAPRERVPAAPAPRVPDMAAASPAPSAAPAATGTVFAQADLPEAVRAQLPSLKISGVTYSSNPVYRMAIVNGQVLHEGDPAGPGLLLEKIEPGRTIWSFKGYRYGLASQ